MIGNKGFLTLDFLFAFVLVMGFSALIFALSMTLTVAEIAQYITFAAARNYSASNIDQSASRTALTSQEGLAKYKYIQLASHPVFKPLFTQGWFLIENPPEKVGDISRFYPSYQPSDPEEPNLFIGVGTLFTAKILDFNIPFYGSTTDENTSGGSGFQTFIASYLARDVTTSECLNFNRDRWKAIRNLPVQGATAYSVSTSEAGYSVVSDNGC